MAQILDEAAILAHTDEPTKKVFDIWHQECLNYFKHDMDVVVADRRENPQLRDIQGEMNSATPATLGGKFYMVIWLDSVRPPKPILITHELGHWILLLRGYRMIIDTAHTFGDVVGNLNSLLDHPPLFNLQRSLGHEPQEMVDLKTENDIAYYRREKEQGSSRWIADALLIADELIHCSENQRLRLNNVIKKRWPNTNHVVRTIMKTVSSSDLLTPESHFKCGLKLAKELKLGNWIELDQLSMIRARLDKQSELKT